MSMNWILVLFLRQGRDIHVTYMYEMQKWWGPTYIIDGPGLVKFDIAYVNNSYFVQNLYLTKTVPNSKCK